MKSNYKTLLTSSFILYSSYFCYDIPAALNRSISHSKSLYNTFNITGLYSVYALPNIFVPILLTIFFRNLRKPSFTFLLSLIILLGHTIFSIALKYNNASFMLFGRFIFGLGNETLFVLLSNGITENFSRNLSLSLCIFISLGRLGIVTNFILTPLIAVKISPFASCAIGIVLLSFSLLITICLNEPFDWKNLMRFSKKPTTIDQRIIRWEEIIEQQKNTKPFSAWKNIIKESSEPETRNHKIASPLNLALRQTSSSENVWKIEDNKKYDDIQNFDQFIIQDTPSQNKLKKNDIPEFIQNNLCLNENGTKRKKNANNSKLHRKRIKNMLHDNSHDEYSNLQNYPFRPNIRAIRTIHPSFYLLTAIAFLLSFVWAPFYNLGPMLFQSKYSTDPVTSSHLMALIETLQMIFFVFSGYIADGFGHKMMMISAGCILLSISYALLLFHAPVLLVVCVMSIAAPLHSLYWSLVNNLCNINYVPIAFAILSCQLNLSFTISPIIYSYMIKKSNDYIIMSITSLIITVFVNILSFILNLWDKKIKL